MTNMQFSEFGISMWFRQSGSNIGLQGLADNGRPDGSIHISAVNKSQISVEVKTVTGRATMDVKPVSSMMLLGLLMDVKPVSLVFY